MVRFPSLVFCSAKKRINPYVISRAAPHGLHRPRPGDSDQGSPPVLVWHGNMSDCQATVTSECASVRGSNIWANNAVTGAGTLTVIIPDS